MHRTLLSIGTVSAVALALSAGCASDLASAEEALTRDDVDVAPECAGILDHVNHESFEVLDAYLPRDVVTRVVARRAEVPFVSLADILTVPGIGPARLDHIAAGARRAGRIDASCVGVFDQLAVSVEDQAAILSFVNGANEIALRAAVPFPGVVPRLLAQRPFTTLTALAGTRGIGPAAFRSLRNAAVDDALPGPFEILVDAVNAAQDDVQLETRFDWRALLDERDAPAPLAHATCFGIDPDLLPAGVTVRDHLADGAEMRERITNHVEWADQRGDLGIDPAAGLADLSARTQGRSFFGCYLRYTPDPWSGIDRDFFVDTASGFGVFAELRWSE